jgi:hypothetical protein
MVWRRFYKRPDERCHPGRGGVNVQRRLLISVSEARNHIPELQPIGNDKRAVVDTLSVYVYVSRDPRALICHASAQISYIHFGSGAFFTLHPSLLTLLNG